MAEETQSPWDVDGEQEITLAPGQGLPGFPQGHGPGVYLVDYKQRTIRPKPVVDETQTESDVSTSETQLSPEEVEIAMHPFVVATNLETTPALNQNQVSGQGLAG